LELAAADGIRVVEGEWAVEDLAGARELFATSSLRGVAPIGRLNGRDVGDVGTGPVTRLLMDAYRRLFDREIA
jgi:branched-subunit amino acid aminotransferase/4-amino-4-deoxychorismate lyase